MYDQSEIKGLKNKIVFDLQLEEGNVGLAFFSSGCNRSNLSTIVTAKILIFMIDQKKFGRYWQVNQWG